MTKKEIYDLIVIGSGPGGYVASVRAAQLGLKTACIEKETRLGGVCLNVGCIPSKALLDSSEYYHLAREQFAAHGIKTGRVSLDLATMMARKDQVVAELTDNVRKLLEGNGINIFHGTARLEAADRVTVAGPGGKSKKPAEQALEAGATVILTDEDTAATNFMIRDQRMQQLVVKDKEPITPFIDRVRQLYDEQGVSTVLVMGGSGDYFSVAHQVIQMTAYVPEDVTQNAHRIAQTHADGRLQEGGDAFGELKTRIPLSKYINPYRGRHRVKISAPRIDEIMFGRIPIDIGDVEQIVHISQTRGIGRAIHYALRYMDGQRPLKEVVERVIADINSRGLDILSPYVTGDIARFRGIELAAAINRMRTLEVTQGTK